MGAAAASIDLKQALVPRLRVASQVEVEVEDEAFQQRLQCWDRTSQNGDSVIATDYSRTSPTTTWTTRSSRVCSTESGFSTGRRSTTVETLWLTTSGRTGRTTPPICPPTS